MAKQCQACFGIYEPIGRDGFAYFHTCPPVAHATVTRDGRDGLVPLSKLLSTDVVRVQRGKAVVDVPAGDMLPDDVRLGDVTIARADGRDENVEIVVNAKRERITRIKAEGAGVIDVVLEPPAALPVLEAP